MTTLAALAAQQRAERARLEADAAARLVTAYGRAWDAISRDLAALTQAIEAAQGAGVAITPELLRGSGHAPILAIKGESPTQAAARVQARYRALMDQVEGQINELALQAGPLVRQQQAAAISAAASHAEALAHAALGPPPPGVAVSWNRVPVEATRELIGALGDGRPLGELLSTFGPEARAAADEALTTALVRGSSPRLAAQALEAAVQGLGRNRALRLARTETMRAYRAASIANYAQNEAVVAWRWLSAHGKNTCLACLGRDGQVFEKSKPFPAHANCRCASVPITRTWKELGFDLPEPAQPETGAAWFARQPETTQRAMLGPTAYPLFVKGDITLADFVEEGTNRWGPYTVQKPIRDILRSIEAVAAD